MQYMMLNSPKLRLNTKRQSLSGSLYSSLYETPNSGNVLHFFIKFCDVNKFEDLEMDTDFRCLALAEKKLEDCIRPEMKAQ